MFKALQALWRAFAYLFLTAEDGAVMLNQMLVEDEEEQKKLDEHRNKLNERLNPVKKTAPPAVTTP
jgi:hypothetical protein